MIHMTLLSSMLLQVAYSLTIRSDINSQRKSNALRRVLEHVGGSSMFMANEQETPQQSMYDILAKQVQEEESKRNKKHRHHLRSVVSAPSANPVIVNTDRAELVAKELEDTVGDHKPMLFAQPHVEPVGTNDFLVFDKAATDQFVTIIPNDIYYSPGAKICVNWLDECSIQGIRARLLHRVRSP